MDGKMVNGMKKIPVGYEDIREIIDKDLFYIDKTLMIRELLDRGGKVSLFTRPRRFGKTLNLSMLRRFFELELDENGQKIDNSYIFRALRISSCGEQYTCHQEQYPVICLTLKSAKQPDYEMAYASILDEISKEYRRHSFVLKTRNLTDAEKKRFRAIMDREAEKIEYAKALEFLSYCLSRYYGKNAIVLIDEYDVPLENAYFERFYEEMTAFIRSLFESVLKTNPYLEFAVITGCLRISRESIFTGLNNLEIYSILSEDFDDSFGFTDEEVKHALQMYGLEEKYGKVREWYNGYCFGQEEIYNPWSIVNYIKTAVKNKEAFPKPYWSNTSSNNIVRDLVEYADSTMRQEIEDLISGKVLKKPIHEDVTYGDIHESEDNLWNFLFFTGYLKKTEEHWEDDCVYVGLAIPNMEIRSIYRNTVLGWFEKKVRSLDMSELFRGIENGDCEAISSFLSEQLLETISFYDYSENYYHGFLCGLLKTSSCYRVYSNRESGYGRPDIVLKTPMLKNGSAVIMELKVADSFRKMEECCRNALNQICVQKYDDILRREGYSDIRKYGICFYRKECMVMLAED